VLKLNVALGYDFNTVEFAVRDGVPLAIDFCNPAPDADLKSVGQANFDWIVEAAANLAIRRAKEHKPGQMNLTWGTFVQQSVQGAAITDTLLAAAAKAPAAKAEAAPAAEKKPAAKAKAK
jgi:hypothetical protein